MGLREIIHPNRISFYGLVSTTTGVGMLFNPSTREIGAGMILMGSAMDSLDGQIARRYGMKTKEGARIDSFFDKLKNAALGGYIATREILSDGYALAAASTLNIVSDFLWQRQRGPYLEQIPEAVRGVYNPESCTRDEEAKSSIRANYWGKTKAVIQMGVGLAYVGREVIESRVGEVGSVVSDNLNGAMTAALATSLVLGTIGGIKRIKKGRETVMLGESRVKGYFKRVS